MTDYVLAIDQGTTSTRAILFDKEMQIAAIAQRELEQHYPRSGWVEHDPTEIWTSALEVSRKAIEQAGASATNIAAIGITNQRETVIVWDRETGQPVYRAIVWQDRRTAEKCETLRAAGHEAEITAKTGLIIDPYFSGTKLGWILDNVEGAREKAERDALCFGTVDSYLLWQLTGGKVHATDATNASRTLLYDIGKSAWSEDLCRLLGVPMSMLPEVKDCAADFGLTSREFFGEPIRFAGVAGDQQAATVGQACFSPGMAKSTYGTGCFIVLNTGDTLVRSQNRLLSTIAYQLDGRPTYALEGSIFVAGAAVQWLRDGLQIIGDAAETGPLAAQADPDQDIYLVPAFVGLGAPYWDAECRGAIFGLTRNSGRAEFARAALESVCFQTRDLTEAMHRDWGGGRETVLRVDGGMVASDWTMQRLADILNAPVDRPKILETTALGAAYLAGMKAGIYPGLEAFAQRWSLDRQFTPQMEGAERDRKYAGWKDVVSRTLTQPARG